MKLIAGILIISIVVFGGLRLFSRKLLYFPVPLDRTRKEQLARPALPVKEFSHSVAGNITLRGWIIEKDMKNLPTLFYFGGNAEEVSLNIEDYLARVEANVVLVNYRGYGQSQGKPGEDELKADALALFDRVAGDYSLSPDRCGAWGRSLGSSIASYLVWKRGLKHLILTCPFDSIEAVAAGFYPAWLVGLVLTDRHRTTDFSGEIRAASLILAAADDEIIPAERTQALYESLAGSKRMVTIRGAGHNTISEARGYYEAVNEFLKK